LKFQALPKLRQTVHFYDYHKSPLQKKARWWYSGLLQAIESLSHFPKRCPLAGEDKLFSQEIRQLLYGRGRSSYRILFTILEGQSLSTVRIFHIRNALQRGIGEDSSESDAT
jgi:hypothetical protein